MLCLTSCYVKVRLARNVGVAGDERSEKILQGDVQREMWVKQGTSQASIWKSSSLGTRQGKSRETMIQRLYLRTATCTGEATGDKGAGVENQALMRVARPWPAWWLLGRRSRVSGCFLS